MVSMPHAGFLREETGEDTGVSPDMSVGLCKSLAQRLAALQWLLHSGWRPCRARLVSQMLHGSVRVEHQCLGKWLCHSLPVLKHGPRSLWSLHCLKVDSETTKHGESNLSRKVCKGQHWTPVPKPSGQGSE